MEPGKLARIWLRKAAVRHLAVPKVLKSIDYSIGLVKRITHRNIRLPGGNNLNIIKRLVALRKVFQANPSLRPQNLLNLLDDRIATLGRKAIEHVTDIEQERTPDKAAVAAFLQKYPKAIEALTQKQAAHLIRICSKQLGLSREELLEQVVTDQAVFDQCWEAVAPLIQREHQNIASMVAGGNIGGKITHRTKKQQSVWDKQRREQPATPFFYFKDLSAFRIEEDSFKGLTHLSRSLQQNFSVAEKKNFYLQVQPQAKSRYNAINYFLASSWLVFEIQVKVETDTLDAALAHDIIYAPEKAEKPIPLSPEEQHMVSYALGAASYLSQIEWDQVLSSAD
jgi:ppGpp synthetase/RelA/SpoT-type nucleotidyltranferase